MKKLIPLFILFFCLGTLGAVHAQESSELALKAGDQLYVCNCGKKCDCDTMSMKPGKCACGKTMAKGKVIKLDGGNAIVAVGKGQRSFKTAGQYACACGAGCNCSTISQKPGKCACGKPMKMVKAKN